MLKYSTMHPKEAVLYANKNTYKFHRYYDKRQDLLKNGEE